VSAPSDAPAAPDLDDILGDMETPSHSLSHSHSKAPAAPALDDILEEESESAPTHRRQQSSSGGNGDLLAQIRGGASLKKTKTVDKSSPLGVKSSSSSSPSSSAGSVGGGAKSPPPPMDMMSQIKARAASRTNSVADSSSGTAAFVVDFITLHFHILFLNHFLYIWNQSIH
jgi:hypothetical protein